MRLLVLAVALAANVTPAVAQPADPPDPEPDRPDDAGHADHAVPPEIEHHPMRGRERVSFNLEGMDLPALARLMSEITGRRFILPQRAPNLRATVVAPTEVSAAEAYQGFLSILAGAGLTVRRTGTYYEIIELEGIQNQATSTELGTGPVPNTDQFITRMIRLRHVRVEDAHALLVRFGSQAGVLTPYAPTNVLFITDTGANIRRMVRVLDEIDLPTAGERIWVERIHHASAVEVVDRLTRIFTIGGDAPRPASPSAPEPPQPRRPGNEQGAPSPSGPIGAARDPDAITNLIAEERTNSIIILATERAYLRIMQLLPVLDAPAEAGGRVHVHRVEHANVADVAAALESLLRGGGAPPSSRRTTTTRPTTGPPATPAPSAPSATPVTASSGPVAGLFEGEVQLSSYEPTNSLMIVASPHDYQALRQIIEQLDVPRSQVFIEAVIMELNVDRSRDVDPAYSGVLPGLLPGGASSLLGFNIPGLINPSDQVSVTGAAIGVQLPGNGIEIGPGLSIPPFGALVTALAAHGEVNVLSTPHIMTLDNVEAEISIGDNIPLQDEPAGNTFLPFGTTTDPSAAAASSFATAGAVPRGDVGTTILVTPHINEDGDVRLEIEQTISAVSGVQGRLNAVTIGERSVRTEVVVRDAQTIVIGGLVNEELVSRERGVPVLGDIPILGALFRQRHRERHRGNLLLLMTPHVIRGPEDVRAIYERRMQERQELLDRYFVFGDVDYEPPVDYSRTRGLVLEIVNELDSIEDERTARAEARPAEPPPHVPQAPLPELEPAP